MISLLSIYRELLQRIDWNLFGLAVVLFTMGVVVGPRIVARNIRFLIAYPLWIYNCLEKILRGRPRFFKLFVIIFCFNATSLFLSFLSGFTGVLPFLFAFLTGLNVSIITFKVAGRMGFAAIFLNPVALMELPAAWIALSLGMSLGLEILSPVMGLSISQFFMSLWWVYILFVLPLLFLSGLLEAALITSMQKHDFD
ncbi:MAG: stage II sporulation protein M [Gemmatimonadota bacterium]|nr:MAG: stage II sporulation protein M [Gemmatimonadota bacterium]